jgi:DtxR family Mn-dependent transcriptional regulator
MPAERRSRANTESVDNYLKAILYLGGADAADTRRVSSSALAERLGVAPASVTNMLQKLAAAADPPVEYERHRGVRLSPAGKRRALEVVRHHRLIETFLFEVLDYPIDEVHDEAERLEHFISERFEERIAAKLGYPTSDPHGHSIPSLTGEMLEQDSIPLSAVESAGSYIVASVSDEDGEALRRLKSIGIVPGAWLHLERNEPGAAWWVRVGHSLEVVELTLQIARDIRVAPSAE